MQEQLKALISDIENKTGKSVAVYDFLGDLVARTDGAEEGYAFRSIASNNFIDGIFADETTKYTYFMINVNHLSQPLLGVISGADKDSTSYAFMISSIIENAFRHFIPEPNISDAFSSVLLGTASTLDIKRIKDKYGFSDGLYYIYAISVDNGKIGEIMNFLTSFSTSQKDLCLMMDGSILTYIKHIDPEEENVGVNELAVMLFENVKTELSLNLSICAGSPASGLHEFRESYSQAVSGLRMGKYFNYSSRVYSYKEFLLVSILEELPRKVIENYKRRNLDPSTVTVFEDPDLTLTAEVFMNHSLNISETARSLYVHRNTLMYRLDKIERDTGLNIRVFSDAVTFRILEVLYKMNEKTK